GQKLRPRIGLAWSGSPSHRNDHNRSISLRSLVVLLHSEATFVSLQKGFRPDDAAVLKECMDILQFSDEIDDFSDTSALIDRLDLVISVDTSVAHLAGALGKPTWILRPSSRTFAGCSIATTAPGTRRRAYFGRMKRARGIA